MQQCVEDFHEAKPSLSDIWTQKLDYLDSDVIRMANIVRRMRQFLHTRARLPFPENSISIRDLQYALHNWSRQLEFYSGLIQCDEHVPEQKKPDEAEGRDTLSLVMKLVLQNTPSTTAEQDTHQLRKKLRGRLANICERGNKDNRKKKVGGPANTLLEAVKELKTAGLLTLREEKKAAGHEVVYFKKRQWSEINEEPVAMERCRSLRVASENFPHC